MFLIAMPDFASGAVWMSLLTLTLLEIVLGVDNIIFLSIISAKLPAADQPRARNIGLLLAMLLRIILLFGITWITSMKEPLFYVDLPWLESHEGTGEHVRPFVNGQGLILLLGGIFLLYKATTEIHHKLEGRVESDDPKVGKGKQALNAVIIQIALINIVFSFDSILTAIGIASNVVIMILAVVLSMLVMMLFSGPVSKFVNDHPTVQMLGLSFLILIGFSLIAEAAHDGHFIDSAVPKGYLYFAIFFSLFTEILNIRVMKKQKPVQLHGYAETAKKRGLLDDDLLDDNVGGKKQ
jgi:predicted tellurium resistance membrane protein TerC